MKDNSNSTRKSRWNSLAPYMAFLFGALILLFVIFKNKPDNTDNIQTIHKQDHPLETTGAAAQPNTQDSNAVITNSTSTPAAAQPDPFTAFMEAHKNVQPQVNAQPKPQTPEEIRNVFKAAVEKMDINSAANPFANAKNLKSTNGRE